jgi:methyl-accepting chemotaxis protein/methyl-accepting chemotaxis protein-1 (serine sensor receptor)
VAIRAVTEDSTKVKVMVDEVSLGSEEQSRGIEQIGRAIVQIEQITRNNAAGSEESAAAAEELSAQSESLREVLNRLQEMVGGGGNEGMPAMRGSIRPSTRPAAFKMAPSKLRSGSLASRAATNNVPTSSAKNNEFPMEESFQSF